MLQTAVINRPRMKELAPDLVDYIAQLEAADDRARSLVLSLSEVQAAWRPHAGTGWSIAQCLEHLSATNRTYLQSLRHSVVRSRPCHVPLRAAGWLSLLFLQKTEPPVTVKIKAPKKIQPVTTLPPAQALATFVESNAEVRDFVVETADRDLCGTRFRNPFVPGLRFTIATGLLIMAAHNRRHLWQAEKVRAEGDFPG